MFLSNIFQIDESNWGVSAMDLVYSTSDSLFRGVIKGKLGNLIPNIL